jgi:hypothetical protein
MGSVTQHGYLVIAHHRDYIIQHVGGNRRLVGSDVNLIRRMLTEARLAHLHFQLENPHPHVESYEHPGEVQICDVALHTRYEEIVSQRRIFLTEEIADLIFAVDFSVPHNQTLLVAGME